MADKIATREAYGKTLVELGKVNENIVVLDADLAEATKTVYFKEEFPEIFHIHFTFRRVYYRAKRV